MFVRLTKDMTYLKGNEGQKFRTVFSETAPLYDGCLGPSISIKLSAISIQLSFPFHLHIRNATGSSCEPNQVLGSADVAVSRAELCWDVAVRFERRDYLNGTAPRTK